MQLLSCRHVHTFTIQKNIQAYRLCVEYAPYSVYNNYKKEGNMGRHTAIEVLTRMLQLVKIMSRPNGATITQMSNETGIDRWTVKDMIDSLENIGNDGKSLCIEEYQNPEDHRQTYYCIKNENKWTLTLPGLCLSDEEGALLSFLVNQSKQIPVLKDASEGLTNKLNWLNHVKSYPIYNVNAIERIVGPNAKESLDIIVKSIQNDDCLEFMYFNAGESKKEKRQVLPLYMFAYDGGLYLNAQKVENGELRTYAFERIQDIPKIIKVKHKPEKLPYDGRLEDPFGPFWDSEEEIEVEITFDSWQGWYNLQKRWPESVSVTKNDDETYTLKARTHSIYGARRFIMNQDNHVLGLKPEWL